MRKPKKTAAETVSKVKDTAAKVVSKVEDVVLEEVVGIVEDKVEEVVEVIKEVKEKAANIVKVISVFRRMWHPDQKLRIEQHEPRELKKDSWTESQIKAGLLKEV